MVRAVNAGSGWGSKVYVEQVRRTAERSEVQDGFWKKSADFPRLCLKRWGIPGRVIQARAACSIYLSDLFGP